MDKKNKIGAKIKTLRKNKGLTQEQLTAKINTEGVNIDRPMISRIENQTREIVDYEIEGVAKALGVKIEQLFEEDKQ